MSIFNNITKSFKSINGFHDIVPIVRHANSLSFSNIITNLTYIYILAIVAKHSDSGIYLFSFLFPIQYLVSSLNASLVKVSLQITANKEGLVSTSLLRVIGVIYAILACGIFFAFASSYYFSNEMSSIVGAGTFLKFTCMYTASDFLKNLLTTTSTIISVKRHGFLYLHTIISCISAVVAAHYFSNVYSCGIYSYPIAVFVSSTLPIVLIGHSLYNKKSAYMSENQKLQVHPILTKTISGIKRHFYVFLGILASSYLSSQLGKESMAGFNLVMRIRYIYSIPAISLGIAAAVACLPLIGLKDNKLQTICKFSTTTLLCYYIAIGVTLYLLKAKILCFFINDEALLRYAEYYYSVCLYNIIGFAIYSMYIDFFDTAKYKKTSEYIIAIQLLSQTIIWWGLNQYCSALSNYLYAVIGSFFITLLYIVRGVYKFVTSNGQNTYSHNKKLLLANSR